MGEPTDETLMERFRSGDQAAFDVLYGRHAPAVHGFIGAMVRDGALADDLLQITFLSMIRSRDRFESGAKVAPWLFSIAANASRDALRRRKRQLDHVTDTGTVEVEPGVEPTTSDPGLRRQLQSALDTLPSQQREAVVLHKVQGLSFEEIAQALGTTVTAARIRAHRGYERLRALLAHLETT